MANYVTELPLHGGKAPKWLFYRMVKLSNAIAEIAIDEYGEDRFISMISNSNWFQAFACAIGYDWHSSGTTTVTIAALKEALKDNDKIFIAGGKGKAGTNTPEEIIKGTDKLSINKADEFIRYSRMAAKIDSSLIYDDIGIYHHSFIFSKNGKWAVIQQAMQAKTNKAIRFQWFSDFIKKEDVANEPHTGIDANMHQQTLDLTYSTNSWAREKSVQILQDNEIGHFSYPSRHHIYKADISKHAWKMIKNASDLRIDNYNDLLLVKGAGRQVLRSLAIISSLIFDKELAYRDPVAYSYNLGGKDSIPFKINRLTYDKVTESLYNIIENARIETKDKYAALKRLNYLVSKKTS
ncbi:MAG: DUF763 domain-containing protein [Candidatus Micrarchaeaceae archaeon]